MHALAVAAPALDHMANGFVRRRVAGSGSSAAYVSSPGFVLALTAPGVPLMPNGIALDRAPARWPSTGARVRCSPGLIELGDLRVRWDAADPPVWSSAPSQPATPADREALAARGEAILRACGVRPAGDAASLADSLPASGLEMMLDAGGRRGVVALLRALELRDPPSAAAAMLLGRGSGLTPEGDDLLSGAAATVARFGVVAGLDGSARESWLAAVVPPDVARRSPELSVTLLELAAAGHLAEPAHRTLDLTDLDWRRSLRQLLAVGASTGRAYAVAIGSAALLLGSARS